MCNTYYHIPIGHTILQTYTKQLYKEEKMQTRNPVQSKEALNVTER